MEGPKTPEWIKEIRNPRLWLEMTNLRSPFGGSDFADLIRAAFVYFEKRIRETAGLDEHEFGKPLLDKAFHPETGILQPSSTSPAECAGLHNLLVGIFLYYRNPIAHRNVKYTEEEAKAIILLIDHALSLVQKAAESVVNLEEFVGVHEGQILRRHDYRIDIDNDGIKEIVVLLELGQSSIRGRLSPSLSTVIFKKIGSTYRRIPAEVVGVSSLYGPSVVKTIHVTDIETPDLFIYWTHGMSSGFASILRRDGDKYVVAKREEIEGVCESWMPSGSGGFLTHYRQEFSMADFDGDGLTEIVQELEFSRNEIEDMGYDLSGAGDGDLAKICRVIKWDKAKQLLVQVSENVIVESSKPQGSLSFLNYMERVEADEDNLVDPDSLP